MDFSISAETQARLDVARRLIDTIVIPLEPAVLSRGFSASESALDGARAAVRAAGLWAPGHPESLGGQGLSLVELGLLSEVMGRSPLGHYCFGSQAPDAGNIEILHGHGSPAQRERWLTPLAAGEIRSCFSMTEPDTAGSNPTLLATTARLDEATNEWVIDGVKWFTSSADGAAFAIVMAVTEPDAPPHARASMIIVPTDAPGYRRVRNIPIMGDAGDGYMSHAEIAYEGCRVPAQNLLGARGAAFAMAQERLGPGRIHHCMRWIGICERSLELMLQRATTRQMGRGQVLGDKQIVRAWLAEARAKIDAARWMVLNAAWTIDNEGFYAARDKVSLIKFFVADVMMEVVDRAVQVHGALGVTSDTVLAFFYSHERGARIYDGPDEVHKMSVARRMLKTHARAAQ